VLAEVIKQTGVDPNYIAGHYGKTHGDRSTATSRGKEFEITYNPTRYWTVKSTITQAKVFNAQMSPETAGLYQRTHADLDDHQRPVHGHDPLNFWWTTTIGHHAEPFYTANVLAPVKLPSPPRASSARRPASGIITS
jgi:hypothetical protein